MSKITGEFKKNKLVSTVIILIFLVAAIIYLAIKIREAKIAPINLRDKDHPIQIRSYDNSTIDYQKIMIHSPFEISIDFTCDRKTSKVLDYNIAVTNHDDRIKSSVNVRPLCVLVDDEMNTFLYNYFIEIHVTKETINDLNLLKSYEYITKEELKESESSLNSGYRDCLVSTETERIKEKLPTIN